MRPSPPCFTLTLAILSGAWREVAFIQVNSLPHFIERETEALPGHVQAWSGPREEESGAGRWVLGPLPFRTGGQYLSKEGEMEPGEGQISPGVTQGLG